MHTRTVSGYMAPVKISVEKICNMFATTYRDRAKVFYDMTQSSILCITPKLPLLSCKFQNVRRVDGSSY